MAEKELAGVYLWGSQIGTLIWSNNRGYFEFQKDFQRSGIQPSPITMPLSNQSYSFPGLQQETYKGLPGLLADSLPDKFGNRLINQWLERQGRLPQSFNPIERLCYIGTRGMGALEFQPAIREVKETATPLQVTELVALANEALSERSSVAVELGKTPSEKKQALEKIISVGTSAGGARAKAVIAWNPNTNEVRSGQVKTDPEFEYWLLKFDGVEENRDHEQLADPKGYSLIEYAYYLMAVACGIEMMECRIFNENGRSHFMTRRFDRRDGGEKVHMQSLCGLAHFDFNQAGAYSYEEAIGVMRQLNLSKTAFKQFFRRLVFNVVARNQDDHTKNIAFLMDKQGSWSLSPAYDLTYCNGAGWTNQHQMTVNGKRNNFTLRDLLAVARHADIREGDAKEAIAEVIEQVKLWPGFAEAAGVPQNYPGRSQGPSWTEMIQKDHRVGLLH